MRDISLGEAKSRLSELVQRAERGEEVRLLRRGKAVARLMPIDRPKMPIDPAALDSALKSAPPQANSAGDFVRRMRDEDRY